MCVVVHEMVQVREGQGAVLLQGHIMFRHPLYGMCVVVHEMVRARRAGGPSLGQEGSAPLYCCRDADATRDSADRPHLSLFTPFSILPFCFQTAPRLMASAMD